MDFYFYIPSKGEDYSIYYCDFIGQKSDWLEKECDFALVAVVASDGKRIVRKNIKDKELSKIQKTFESHIVSRLKERLVLAVN